MLPVTVKREKKGNHKWEYFATFKIPVLHAAIMKSRSGKSNNTLCVLPHVLVLEYPNSPLQHARPIRV